MDKYQDLRWAVNHYEGKGNSIPINRSDAAALLAERDALRAVAEETIARLENYERHGEICPFEGEPMIYAATLIELGEQARAALSQ